MPRKKRNAGRNPGRSQGELDAELEKVRRRVVDRPRYPLVKQRPPGEGGPPGPLVGDE